jgi:dynein light intermediate chain 1
MGSTAGATSPLGAGVGTAGAGGASNEVLANFFQSLLSKKVASGGSPTSASPTSSLLNGALSGAGTGASGVSTGVSGPGSNGLGGRDESAFGRRSAPNRKEVHKELDRMRQNVNKP